MRLFWEVFVVVFDWCCLFENFCVWEWIGVNEERGCGICWRVLNVRVVYLWVVGICGYVVFL